MYTNETGRLGLLDYKDWALDAIVGKKDFLNLSVRHLKSDTKVMIFVAQLISMAIGVLWWYEVVQP